MNSRERELVVMVERNMCDVSGVQCPPLPGSRATSRANRSRRNLGYLSGCRVGLHPLESAAYSRRTPQADLRGFTPNMNGPSLIDRVDYRAC